ncbi:MAG TPA: hypothetical protein VFJ21_13285 [Mycobacteriales bacterium]|nr:hypothetical protein [Mycobacteriales bacterium]
MEREHGRIVSVSTETVGSTLTADVAAGVTVLPVYDAAAFDSENGGSVSVGGSVLAYSTADDDASTVTLTDPLPAAASDGDRVDCWNPLYQAPFTVKTAMVQLDGDDDNPDPIEATVPHFLADKLADGDRGGPGESCTLEYDADEDEWQILDVRGLAGASGAGVKFCNTDTYTVAVAGDQTIALSHTPLDGSLDVKWHPRGLGGIPLTSAQWTLDGSTLTVPDPTGVFAATDLIDPQYTYRDVPIAPHIIPDPVVLQDLGLAGPYTVAISGTGTTSPAPNDTLSDNDESTSITVDQYIGQTGITNNSVSGHLPTGGTVDTSQGAEYYALIKATGDAGAWTDFKIVVVGGGTSSSVDTTKPSKSTTLGTIFPMDANCATAVTAANNGSSVSGAVYVPINRTNHVNSVISEAHIIVIVPGTAD